MNDNHEFANNGALLVATLSFAIFLISLFIGEIELGWFDAGFWALMFRSKS